MKELRIEAKVDNLQKVLSFVDAEMEALGCTPKAIMQMDIAVEEIFVNIAHYAYAPGSGHAVIKVDNDADPTSIVVSFADEGMPFDPLARDDPDTTLSADERRIGGLGIFMVKKGVDDIHYEFKDHQNVLTIRKNV